MRESTSVEQDVALFRTVFDDGPIGKAISSLDGQIIRTNTALATMLGYSVEELATKSLPSLIHPHDVVGWSEATSREVRLLARDGHELRAQLFTSVHRGDDGTPLHLFTHFVDATQRKRAESARNASETRYRRLFESAKDGILILEAQSGRIVDVNPFMTEMTGYSREEFLGEHLWEIGPFKDAAASKLEFAQLKAKNYIRYDDLPLRTRDGRTVAVEFISNVYIVNDEKVIQCNVRDISERKQLEFERVRLTMAIDQSAEAVVVTDAFGAIEYVNPAFQVVSGYSKAEVLGRNMRLLKSGAQDDKFYLALWQTLSRGGVWRGRMVNRRKDGTPYTEDATISPVRDAGGVIISYVAVERDVTATLALEAQLLQMQKMESVGQLAGGVAHDFNNLLTVISSANYCLRTELPRDKIEWHEASNDIDQAVTRATALTRQLLTFCRQEVIAPRRLSLNTLVTDTLTMLRRLLGEDIQVKTRLAPNLAVLEADPGQLTQVLINLAVNARDAMPRGGTLTIATSELEVDEAFADAHLGAKAGSYFTLSVSDTGEGMSREVQKRAFEPFFTTKATGTGTGLGLSVVFGVIRQAGGFIELKSRPGEGTTFDIHLPQVIHGAETASSDLESAAPAGDETILLVEDDASLRKSASESLRRFGYTVLEAPTAAVAIHLLAQSSEAIDLLITDVVMPDIDGRQLSESAERLRPGLPVLYISGYLDDAVMRHGVSRSEVAFLQKPFIPAALAAKVRSVLESVREPAGETSAPLDGELSP